MLCKLFLFLPSIYLEYLYAARCRAPPSILQTIQSCCPLENPNWGAFSECDDADPEPSCRFTCIFNAASVLRGDRLILSRVRPMLNRVFDNADTIDAYVRNYASCAALVRKRYRDIIQISSESGTCDRHALFYSFCAYSKLIQNCPADVWLNTRNCQLARNYMKNCPWPALAEFIKTT